jgi:hypothetical protein
MMSALPLRSSRAMVNFFMVGSSMVRWEINCVGEDVCRLTVTHQNGTIVEYFRKAAQALDRQREIEGMFLSSQSSERV